MDTLVKRCVYCSEPVKDGKTAIYCINHSKLGDDAFFVPVKDENGKVIDVVAKFENYENTD